MNNVLILVAVVVAAYAMAHKVFERLRDRFLVTMGAEYILIGLLLGPEMPWKGAFEAETLNTFAPIMNLAVGWVGLLYGMNANVARIVSHRDGSGTVAATETAVTFVVVGLVARAVLGAGWFGAGTTQEVNLAAWVLGASAAVGSASVIELVRRRYRADGPLTELLDRAARLGELAAIVAFGLVFCVYRGETTGSLAGWNYANWILVTLVLGGGLGLLFRLFLGNERDVDKQFLALLGIVVFASGAAYYLELSPLLVNLVLGVVLSNVAPNSEQVLNTLTRYHRAMIIVLLLFAGALWRPVPGTGWALALGYVLLRAGGKLLGGRLAAASLGGDVRGDVGRGLLGHGEVAMAMALGMRVVYHGPLVDLVFTAILASALLSETWSARAVRGLLLDGGEIQPEQTVARPEGGAEAPAEGEA